MGGEERDGTRRGRRLYPRAAGARENANEDRLDNSTNTTGRPRSNIISITTLPVLCPIASFISALTNRAGPHSMGTGNTGCGDTFLFANTVK